MTSGLPVKRRSSLPSERLGLAPIIAAFVVIALGFVVATVYSEIHASAIDREAAQLEVNALPSLEHLSAARAALWRLDASARQYAREPGGRSEAGAAITTARGEVGRQLAAEFATDLYPGEAGLQEQAARALNELDRLLETLRGVSAESEAGGQAFAEHELHRGMEKADAAIERLLSLNAEQGHAEAKRIGEIRIRSVRRLVALNVACIVLAAVAAFVSIRSLRRQRSLELAHEGLLEERAAELEQFASRVAHDLLSPLSALHFNLSSLERNAKKGLPIGEPMDRARACLKRSQTLVNCVMDFARSGAAPAGGRASLRSTLDGVLEESRTDSDGITFAVEGVDDDVTLACSAGVLTSVLANLVQNAVKYLAGSAEKRVTIRGAVKGAMVRVEVEDTGPGLPPGLEDHVFEPYVRSPDNPKPGLGLGLATVQRFVESHRGRVGVASSPSHGCCFWFELPLADRPAGATAS
jgi:signal transduction histidine kinase